LLALIHLEVCLTERHHLRQHIKHHQVLQANSSSSSKPRKCTEGRLTASAPCHKAEKLYTVKPRIAAAGATHATPANADNAPHNTS
jgi:hypothetical protein